MLTAEMQSAALLLPQQMTKHIPRCRIIPRYVQTSYPPDADCRAGGGAAPDGGTRPRLVLLDLVLPGCDGVELMGDLLAVSRVPVVFLSVYGRDEVIARALEAGATDYIVKPFSPTELVARVRAVLRRRAPVERPEPSQPYVVGDLTVNFAERRVSMAGRPVRLTDMEYRVLAELAASPGRVVNHPDLLLRAWGPAHAGGSGPVRTIVKNLRDKLGEDAENPTYIFNEPRIGYRLGHADQPDSEAADLHGPTPQPGG